MGASLASPLTIDAADTPVALSITGVTEINRLVFKNATGRGLSCIGTAWLNRSTVQNCAGRGIQNMGTLTIEASTISANATAATGAGINNTGTLTVAASTISGNTTTAQGGGIFNSGSLTLRHSTISANAGSSGGGLLHTGPGTAAITHTIISGNTATVAGRDVAGSITSSGWNLVGITDGSSGWNLNDLQGTIATPRDAKLSALANNGGPTFTHTLLGGSPATDAGNPAILLSGQFDQRGSHRVDNGRIDIGAVEVAALSFGVLSVPADADSDHDGMTDDWERLYGLNPNSAADAALDPDKDGQSNIEEFRARTAPNSAASVFALRSVKRTANPNATQTVEIVRDSVPGVIYSLWSSVNLTTWDPVAGSNLVAMSTATRLNVTVPAATTRVFHQVRTGAAAGAGAPHFPDLVDAFIPVSDWAAAGLINSGNGNPLTRWDDAGTAPYQLLPGGGPIFRTGATPLGQPAVEFRGGTFNDTLAGVPGSYGLAGAEAFTVAIVFKPDGDSESSPGTDFSLKSQLLSAAATGPANDWGLGYAANTLWFGLGSGSGNDATLTLPAAASMPGAWWTAVITWTAPEGGGNPVMAAWLFDANGQQVAASARINPNTLAGTTGLFTAPRATTGLALGGDRTSLTTRNFDGHIAAVRCYTLPAEDSLARRIASDLAAIYTHTAQPE